MPLSSEAVPQDVCLTLCLSCMATCRTAAPLQSLEAAAEATPEAGHVATAEAAPEVASGRARPAGLTDQSLLLLAVGLASGQTSRAGQMAVALVLPQCMAFPLQAVALPPQLSPLSPMECCRL